jgi:hypothetical protein
MCELKKIGLFLDFLFCPFAFSDVDHHGAALPAVVRASCFDASKERGFPLSEEHGFTGLCSLAGKHFLHEGPEDGTGMLGHKKPKATVH